MILDSLYKFLMVNWKLVLEISQ